MCKCCDNDMFKTVFFLISSISILFTLLANAYAKTVISAQVITLNPDEGIVTVKIANRPVNLDISNLSLKGYKSFREIKKNNWINIIYTKEGPIIMRSSKKHGYEKHTEIKHEKTTLKVTRLKSKGNNFFDVDNNHDRRISPVELSVIFSGLTMEKFKAYDKDKDGYLDESEFKEAMKNP